MAVKKKTTKKKVSKSGVGGGIGIAALAAATAAGVYFLYGSKNAPKTRKKIKGWTLKVKGEVLEKIEKMENIDEGDYKKIVDTVTKKYEKIKTVSTKEVLALAKELKTQWREISKDADKKSKSKKGRV